MSREQDGEIIDATPQVVELDGQLIRVDLQPVGKTGISALQKPTPKELLARVPALRDLPVWEDG